MNDTLTAPFTPAVYRRFLAEGKLMGSRCLSCGKVHLPPRAICPICRSTELEWTELSGRGSLAAFTAVHIGPNRMNELGYSRTNPYLSGIVALEEGVQISARLVGMDSTNPLGIKIGAPLVMTIIREGDPETAKAVLAFQPA